MKPKVQTKQKQKVVGMPRNYRPPKVVQANQKGIDALPEGSGTWSVAGISGMYVQSLASV